jgi:hypothetical protein
MITKNEIIIDGDRHEGSHRILQIPDKGIPETFDWLMEE